MYLLIKASLQACPLASLSAVYLFIGGSYNLYILFWAKDCCVCMNRFCKQRVFP